MSWSQHNITISTQVIGPIYLTLNIFLCPKLFEQHQKKLPRGLTLEFYPSSTRVILYKRMYSAISIGTRTRFSLLDCVIIDSMKFLTVPCFHSFYVNSVIYICSKLVILALVVDKLIYSKARWIFREIRSFHLLRWLKSYCFASSLWRLAASHSWLSYWTLELKVTVDEHENLFCST